MDLDFIKLTKDFMKQNSVNKNTPEILSHIENYKKDLESENNDTDIAEQDKKGSQELEEEILEIENALKRCRKEYKDLKNTNISLDDKERILQLNKEELDKRRAIGSRTKNEKKLYAMITKIQWDNDASLDEVKGIILGKKRIVPFNFSTEVQSAFTISNHLWDLISSSVE